MFLCAKDGVDLGVGDGEGFVQGVLVAASVLHVGSGFRERLRLKKVRNFFVLTCPKPVSSLASRVHVCNACVLCCEEEVVQVVPRT